MTPNDRKTLDDLVFELRNKEYGSYWLRKQYNKGLVIGFGIALTFILVIVLSYFWFLNSAGDEKIYLYPGTSVYLKNTQGSLMSQEELDSYMKKPVSTEQKNDLEVNRQTADPLNTFTIAEEAIPDTFKPEEETPAPNDQSIDSGLINDSTAFGGLLMGDGFGNGTGDRFDRIPEFPGGNATRYVEMNLRYPAQAIKQKIHGVVVVSFIINKSGQVVDVKVERGVNPIIDEAAVRTIQGMPPWKPGLLHGKPINFLFRMPIHFVPIS